MRLELHCHSTRSDGSHAPAEVARKARERGVELFCLTDHDTFAGHDEAAAELPDAVTVLRGLELSVRWEGRGVHLLMYGLETGPALDALAERLDAIQAGRRERVREICRRLAKLGVPLDPEPILEGAKGRTVGRPDVARALLEAGHVKGRREAFDRYLKDRGPADVPSTNVSLADGLELGRALGARMSMAHPHTLGGFDLVRACYKQHRDEGLRGIEAYYGRYAKAERRPWVRLCEELGLVGTGGSDFHGDALPDVTRPVIDLPEAVAGPLRRWLLDDEVA